MAAPRPRIFGLLTMVAQQALRRKSLCHRHEGRQAVRHWRALGEPERTDFGRVDWDSLRQPIVRTK
jgi:hypothetical protein